MSDLRALTGCESDLPAARRSTSNDGIAAFADQRARGQALPDLSSLRIVVAASSSDRESCPRAEVMTYGCKRKRINRRNESGELNESESYLPPLKNYAGSLSECANASRAPHRSFAQCAV